MIPISLQLWSLRDDTKTDFAGTVKKVAGFGYHGVELAGTGNLSAAEAQKVILGEGLKVSGLHVGWEPLENKFEQVVEEAALFQTKEIILPWMPKEHFASVEACTALGEKLGPLGARLRKAGLKFSYHNHAQEFELLEGRPALEWLLAPCAPRDLSSEVDLYWVYAASGDPVRAVTRLGTRARLLHLKDGADGKQTELGRGKVDFPGVFSVAEKNGFVEWYVVEQEEYNFAPLESIRVCFEYLRSQGKA